LAQVVFASARLAHPGLIVEVSQEKLKTQAWECLRKAVSGTSREIINTYSLLTGLKIPKRWSIFLNKRKPVTKVILLP
jgi:hypothetical protein